MRHSPPTALRPARRDLGSGERARLWASADLRERLWASADLRERPRGLSAYFSHAGSYPARSVRRGLRIDVCLAG